MTEPKRMSPLVETLVNAFVGTVVLLLVTWPIASFALWAGVDYIAGHALSFREVAGFGFIFAVLLDTVRSKS